MVGGGMGGGGTGWWRGRGVGGKGGPRGKKGGGRGGRERKGGGGGATRRVLSRGAGAEAVEVADDWQQSGGNGRRGHGRAVTGLLAGAGFAANARTAVKDAMETRSQRMTAWTSGRHPMFFSASRVRAVPMRKSV